MSPIAEFDQRLEKLIRDFTLRILVPKWTEFDSVWESANGVCDRYQLGSHSQSSGRQSGPPSNSRIWVPHFPRARCARNGAFL